MRTMSSFFFSILIKAIRRNKWAQKRELNDMTQLKDDNFH